MSDTWNKIGIEDDKVHIQVYQDIAPALKQIKEARDKAPRVVNGRFTSKLPDSICYATIPDFLVEEWQYKYGINLMAPKKDDWPLIHALLNSTEYSDFKTIEGYTA